MWTPKVNWCPNQKDHSNRALVFAAFPLRTGGYSFKRLRQQLSAVPLLIACRYWLNMRSRQLLFCAASIFVNTVDRTTRALTDSVLYFSVCCPASTPGLQECRRTVFQLSTSISEIIMSTQTGDRCRTDQCASCLPALRCYKARRQVARGHLCVCSSSLRPLPARCSEAVLSSLSPCNSSLLLL